MADLHSRSNLRDTWVVELDVRVRFGLETCTHVEYSPPENSSPDRSRFLSGQALAKEAPI